MAVPAAFQLSCAGLPWWLGLGLVLLAAGLAWRLSPGSHRSRPVRRLRVLAAVLTVLAACGPELTELRRQQELPRVAVLLDASASMAAGDAGMRADRRLDEAVALGLVPHGARPAGPRRAARRLAAVATNLPAAAAALSGLADTWARGEAAGDPASARLLVDSAELLRGTGLEDLAGADQAMADLRLRLIRAADLLSLGLGDPGAARAAAAGLGAASGEVAALVRQLDRAQAESDAALEAAVEADSPLAQGLEAWAGLSRLERALLLEERLVAPALSPRGRIERLVLGPGAPPWSPRSPGGPTDPASALAALARLGEGLRPAAVLIIGDGRQSAGGDAADAARQLAARGSRVHTLVLGDPEPPPDAVVASLAGPEEVPAGRSVPLAASWRVTGQPGTWWDLVLERDGKEQERRTVRPGAGWEEARFLGACGPESVGAMGWSLRIERSQAEAERAGRGEGLTREVWRGLPGAALADLAAAPGFPDHPAQTLASRAAEVVDASSDYGQRLRGYLIPPVTGDYVFWLCGDGQCELRLGRGTAPDTRVVAEVRGAVERGEWDAAPGQRSQPQRLEAGRLTYLEVRHKQGRGGGHVAVGWQLPDQRLERPIPALRLMRFLPEGRGSGGGLEEASLANNRASCVVAIAPPLKAVLLDAAPRRDARAVAALLERDRGAEVICRWRSSSPRPLLPGPVLAGAALVWLGDLAPGELDADEQERLEQAVTRQGCALLAVAGPRGMPAAYGLGGVADLLPVMAGGGLGRLRPEALAPGPLSELLRDPVRPGSMLGQLPPPGWVCSGVALREGAELAVEATGRGAAPLVAGWERGAGRVLWIGSDELWRWRAVRDGRLHDAFWSHVLAWCLGGRLRGADADLRVSLVPAAIVPGGMARLRVSSSAAPTVLVRQAGQDPVQEPGLERIEEGFWGCELAGLPPGEWRVVVEAAGRREERVLTVRSEADEGLDLSADPAALARIAAAGGGLAADAASAADMLRTLAASLEPNQTVQERRLAVWLALPPLAALALAGAWLMGRRAGMS